MAKTVAAQDEGSIVANAFVTSTVSTLKAMPISALLATWSTNARSSVVVDTNLHRLSVDATVANFWFVFDGSIVPSSWDENIAVIDLSDYGATPTLQFAFSYTAGQTVYCYPNGLQLSDWATFRVAATEIDDGLYVVTIPIGYDSWGIFAGASQPASWNANIGTIYSGIEDNAIEYGSIANILSVDYEDEWVYLEGIEDVGLIFDSQRVTSLVAPTSGIKCKRSSPTHNETILAASTIGYEQTDVVFVVWAQTVLSGTVVKTPVVPSNGDLIVAFDSTWVIKSVKTNVDHSQYRCYCRHSTKEE